MDDIVGTGRYMTPMELRAWTGLLDASRMIDELLARHLTDGGHELTHREYEVLVRLDGAGGRMRMSLLARQIVASPALVSQTVDRLEERAFVRRDRSVEGDGRAVEAVLEAGGRSALGEAAEEHAAIIRQVLIERVGAGRLPTFAAAIGEVADHLRAHRRGEPCGDPSCPVEEDSSG